MRLLWVVICVPLRVTFLHCSILQIQGLSNFSEAFLHELKKNYVCKCKAYYRHNFFNVETKGR